MHGATIKMGCQSHMS